MPPAREYQLAGTRETAEGKALTCGPCGSSGAPALLLLRRVNGADWKPTHRFCLPCIGRACERVTGWRIMAAWSQWLASSKLSHTLKATDWPSSNGEEHP